MAKKSVTGPVFTAQDLSNILILIDNTSITASQAEVVVMLKSKLRQAIEMMPTIPKEESKAQDDTKTDKK